MNMPAFSSEDICSAELPMPFIKNCRSTLFTIVRR